MRKGDKLTVVLTKDIPASYTKSGLEEILHGLAPILKATVGEVNWHEDFSKAWDAYWRWYENEQKRHRVG